MSGPWEKYVDQATKAVMAANYMAADEITEGLVRADVQLALATVGPLIAEDARDRMVAAAGRALERDGGQEHLPIGVRPTDVGVFVRCSCGRNPTPRLWLEQHWAGEPEEGKRLVQAFMPTTTGALPNRHGETVEIDLDEIPEETDRQYAFNGDEADEVWVDRP